MEMSPRFFGSKSIASLNQAGPSSATWTILSQRDDRSLVKSTRRMVTMPSGASDQSDDVAEITG